MIIHYTIPTIDFNAMKTKLLPSLSEFEGAKDLITFGLCFQKYKKEDIDFVVGEFKKHGLTLYYMIKEYHFENGRVPLIEMRDDCAMLNPKADVYCVLDDDNLFSKDYPYCVSDVIKCIAKYFEKYPKCGVIMVTEHLDLGLIKPNVINFPLWTRLGLYIRNIYEDGHILPKNRLNLVGMCQDVICVRQRTNDGYFDAISYTPCGGHNELKPHDMIGRYRYGWAKVKPEEGTAVYVLYHELWNKQFNFHEMKFNHTLPDDFAVPKRKV
jgi:hypothetical protein